MTRSSPDLPDYRDLATRNLDRAVKAEQACKEAQAEATRLREELASAFATSEYAGALSEALALASRERQTRAARDETIAAMERKEAESATRIAALVAELYAAKVRAETAEATMAKVLDLRDASADVNVTLMRERDEERACANEWLGQLHDMTRERDEARESHAHVVAANERLVRENVGEECASLTEIEDAAELRGATWMRDAVAHSVPVVACVDVETLCKRRRHEQAVRSSLTVSDVLARIDDPTANFAFVNKALDQLHAPIVGEVQAVPGVEDFAAAAQTRTPAGDPAFVVGGSGPYVKPLDAAPSQAAGSPMTAPDFEAQARDLFRGVAVDGDAAGPIFAALLSAFAAGERRGAEGMRSRAAERCDKEAARLRAKAESHVGSEVYGDLVTREKLRAMEHDGAAIMIRALPTEEPQK